MLFMKMWVSQSYILNTWVNYKQLYSVQIERCDLWGSQTVCRRKWQVPAAFFIFSAKSSGWYCQFVVGKRKNGGKMETLYYNHLKKLSFLVCCIFYFLEHFIKFWINVLLFLLKSYKIPIKTTHKTSVKYS